MNALSKANVEARNEPFSTLDPTTRRLMLPNNQPFLLTDTVGFIRKLPPALIAAFRATLEELEEANLLIHVVDLTSHNAAEQCETVEDILNDLKLSDKPRITVINKIDLMLPPVSKWDENKALKYITEQTGQPLTNTVLVSAARKWGFNALLNLVQQMLVEK